MSPDKRFTPKSLSASEYIRALFEPSDNIAILLRNRRIGQTLQRITRADIIASPEFQSVLVERNRAGADVFVGMNPIKDGAYSRTKDSLKEIRHAYLDLDRNGDEALKAIHNSLEVPPPNFVLDTSPGKHQVVWKIEGLSIEQAEGLLHGMASLLGGDPAATDATRVLRLPGFANKKLAEEFVVVTRQETDKVYSLRDFAIPDESQEAPRHVGDGAAQDRVPRSGHKSQSERDWAYAKRALARGDDPETVIQRIADFRSEDKADPGYCARHTVMKAQAELQHPAVSGGAGANNQLKESTVEETLLVRGAMANVNR